MVRVLALLAVLIGAVSSARAQSIYKLDPQHASIGFSVSHLGLFVSNGRFDRFSSSLAIDIDHPERTRITAQISADSVDMPSSEGIEMLRSASYFDVVHYPIILFYSTAVRTRSPKTYEIQGELEIRGVRRPVNLTAEVTNRRSDGAGTHETVDFSVSGVVRRSDFGMVADQSFIADTIRLHIQARLQLPGGENGG